MKRRIALFGGTFDPIHKGHMIVARSAAEYISAEEVIFIPARRSPHKHCSTVAGGKDRLAMISAAIVGKSKFCVSDCELKRAEPSYTLDTVREFKRIYRQ